MFGTACMMVLSTGNGVNGFTLDPSIGEFILTAPNMTIPTKVLKQAPSYNTMLSNLNYFLCIEFSPSTTFQPKAKK